MTAVRRETAAEPQRGRSWRLPLEDRILLVAAYWRTNLTTRRIAPLFGVSKSAADRIIDHLGPLLALRPRKRFVKDTVLIVDGTLVPTRDHTIAEQSKNYRHSTAPQVVVDADTRLVVVVGRPVPKRVLPPPVAARNPAPRMTLTAGLESARCWTSFVDGHGSRPSSGEAMYTTSFGRHPTSWTPRTRRPPV
jgi:hypothetical protein